MRRNHLAAAAGCLGLLAVAGCGSSGSATVGSTELIDLGAKENIELFVPGGWTLADLGGMSAPSTTGGDAFYVMAESGRMPADGASAGATDSVRQDELLRLAAEGSAITATFTPVQNCDVLEAALADRHEAYKSKGSQIEALAGVLGGYASLASVTAPATGDSSGSVSQVLVDSVVTVGNGDCTWMSLERHSPADRLDADKLQLTEIAQHSEMTRG